MRDFFISYNQADRRWAEWIGWQLEEQGWTVFLQLWDFRPGHSSKTRVPDSYLSFQTAYHRERFIRQEKRIRNIKSSLVRSAYPCGNLSGLGRGRQNRAG